jgi:hypothetical protein
MITRPSTATSPRCRSAWSPAAQKRAFPTWALALLDTFDRALRPTVKRLLMLEGTMVLRR